MKDAYINLKASTKYLHTFTVAEDRPTGTRDEAKISYNNIFM